MNTHGEAFQKRRDWFLKPEWPTYVAWWVDDDHTPTCEEACQWQEYIHDHGPSAYAFNFKQPFDEKGQPTELDRDLLQQRIKTTSADGPLVRRMRPNEALQQTKLAFTSIGAVLAAERRCCAMKDEV